MQGRYDVKKWFDVLLNLVFGGDMPVFAMDFGTGVCLCFFSDTE